jgi:trk system potassium uptake protein TrkA
MRKYSNMLLSLKVLSPKSPVKKLKFPKNAIIGGYVREDKGYIVDGDTEFIPDDKVVVFSLPDCISKIEKYFS